MQDQNSIVTLARDFPEWVFTRVYRAERIRPTPILKVESPTLEDLRDKIIIAIRRSEA